MLFFLRDDVLNVSGAIFKRELRHTRLVAIYNMLGLSLVFATPSCNQALYDENSFAYYVCTVNRV